VSLRARISWKVFAATIVACATTLAVTDAWATAGDSAAPDTPPLLEVEHCFSPIDSNTPVVSAAPGTTRVTVIIPAITWVRTQGELPVAATTNTGCFPRATDRFIVDDAIADSAVVARVLACPRSGDWRRAGEWVDLHC
jgi:hypothetical protein